MDAESQAEADEAAQVYHDELFKDHVTVMRDFYRVIPQPQERLQAQPFDPFFYWLMLVTVVYAIVVIWG